LPPVEEPTIQVRNWFEYKKETALLLKVNVKNRDKKKVTVRVSFETDEPSNIMLPKSYFKEKFFDDDTKILCHLQKIDPTKEWGPLRIKVEAKEKSAIPLAPGSGQRNMQPDTYIVTTNGLNINLMNMGDGNGSTFFVCQKCKKVTDIEQDFCEACGDPLQEDLTENVNDQYFAGVGTGDGRANQMN
jgi:hypothetical protein